MTHWHSQARAQPQAGRVLRYDRGMLAWAEAGAVRSGECDGWAPWGNQAETYEIGWETYAHNSRREGAREWVEAAAE